MARRHHRGRTGRTASQAPPVRSDWRWRATDYPTLLSRPSIATSHRRRSVSVPSANNNYNYKEKAKPNRRRIRCRRRIGVHKKNILRAAFAATRVDPRDVDIQVNKQRLSEARQCRRHICQQRRIHQTISRLTRHTSQLTFGKWATSTGFV